MRKAIAANRLFSLPGWVLAVTAAHLLSGLGLWAFWFSTGDEGWIRSYFDYQSPLFLVGFAGLELYLCVIAWWQFSVGEPMRWAWCLISMASTCRLAGLIVAQIFAAKWYLNPRYAIISSWNPAMAAQLRQTGLAISGPLHMFFLACGLFLVLRAYRKYHMLVRFGRLDYILMAIVGVYTSRQLFELWGWLAAPPAEVTAFSAINWVTDPLLCLLLFQATFIRRAVINMGGGLIAKCWGAFTAAIFITSVGDMGLWATAYGYLPWPLSSLVWYVWFLASAAYVLGPAYQVEAAWHAKEEITTLTAA
jgi:hypothetical protein